MSNNDLQSLTKERIRYYENLLKQNPYFKYRKQIEEGIVQLKELL